MKQIFVLELNEINFEMVKHYVQRGYLDNFGALFEQHGYAETISEKKYENLEPWIQWVTAHTGLPFEQHEIFRLGDIVDSNLVQIWERLEQEGVRVAAVSPINAANRTSDAAFFVPDPWTKTQPSGGILIRKAHRAIQQAVNDNSKNSLTFRSTAWLALCAATNARPKNYFAYVKLLLRSVTKKWYRAMFLDLLLADIFVSQTKRKKPEFATLFLNAGAHIQHHYMFSSTAYDGDRQNPSWHVGESDDPVLDVYKLYDRIIGQVKCVFPNARLMIATGLHQDPHTDLTYYWRLRDHIAFMNKHAIEFKSIDTLMSRDFVMHFEHSNSASTAEDILSSAKDDDGIPLFEIDNRGASLFVMLTYPNEITRDLSYAISGVKHHDLFDDVAFVAIKNGRHNGIGYFSDSAENARSNVTTLDLADVHQKILESFSV